jgi:hypothetical protein
LISKTKKHSDSMQRSGGQQTITPDERQQQEGQKRNGQEQRIHQRPAHEGEEEEVPESHRQDMELVGRVGEASAAVERLAGLGVA